jgi:Helix-turn-helix of DDE superfamily endonuclease
MFSYETAKQDEKTFVSLTSLRVDEFEVLCKTFSEQSNKVTKVSAKGGRPHSLLTMEDRLFFILVYLKTYPLQEVIAYCFGISQGTANTQIHELSDILSMTLTELGYIPKRITEDMLVRLEKENTQSYGIDATERRIARPLDSKEQKKFYSGKKNAIR